MAKLITKHDHVAAHLAAYDPKYHGEGDAGIQRWSREAQAYLAEDPQRRLPVGDILDVIRGSVRLKGGFDVAPDGPFLVSAIPGAKSQP